MTALKADFRTPHMTADEFLKWDSGDDVRYELIAGEVRAQASPADPHGTIMITLGAAMRAAARRAKPGCRVVGQPAICSAIAGDETVREADLAITCAPQTGLAEVAAPRIVVEIVSSGDGEVRDRAKVAFYQAVPSIQVIVLVFSRCLRCEVWRRGANGWATDPQVVIGREGMLVLPEIDLTMTLAELYEGAEIIA